MNKYDFIIIGGGIFGCFAAYYYAKKYPNSKVTIIEKDNILMGRASYINQARIHFGYHYPRSLSTALSSAKYFDSFCKEFKFATNKEFTKIYGVANNFSLTEPEMFEIFCNNAKIPFKKVNADDYFNTIECENAYEVKEYSFDADQIRNYFTDKFKEFKNLTIHNNESIEKIKEIGDEFQLTTSNNVTISSKFVLNSTYASLNKIQSLFDNNLFKLKYELCEIILCNASKDLKHLGITLMDGPFFSAMPFGNTSFHSLSAVEYTPHKVSENIHPNFNCQNLSPTCRPKSLDNCNNCNYKPNTNFLKMYKLAKKYLSNKHDLEYVKSLFTIKTVPLEAENSDSRPTLIKSSGKNNNFYTVLSGKINTVFDLMEIIDDIQR